MGDKKDGEKKVGAIEKALASINAITFPSALDTIRNTSFYTLAEDLKNSSNMQAIRAIGIALEAQQSEALLAITNIEADYFASLKRLGGLSRTLEINKFVLETNQLIPSVETLAYDESMKNMMRTFSQSTKEITALKRAYSITLPVFDTGILDSLLFKYMSSNWSAFTPKLVTELEVNLADSLVSEVDVKFSRVAPDLDAEIIDEIERGGELSHLSDKAKQYLVSWWPWIKQLLEVVAIIITFQQYYVTQIEGAKTPTELRAVVKSIPEVHKEIMEGERVVIRSSVILRAGPDTSTKEIGRMKLGTRLETKEERGFWVRVEVDLAGDDVEGWVYAPFTLKL